MFNNNIVSNTGGNWIQLPFSTSAVSASFDHNTYYLAGTAGYGGYTPGGDNDNQNPMYFNSANADYRLVYPSPCINAGAGQTNDIGFSDLSGWPRIIGLIPDRGAYESDGNPLGPYVTFNDKFDNSAIDPGYTYLKGSWSEDSESLLGISDRKASMFFPDSVTCISCRVHFRVKNSGRENGISPKIWVVLWYADKSNYIDLLIRPESNKAILRQRLNGTIVAKEKIDILIEPFDGYSFDIQKTGGLINVRKEDGTLLQVPLAGSFGAGKFGFQAKGTYAYLSEFAIYYQ